MHTLVCVYIYIYIYIHTHSHAAGKLFLKPHVMFVPVYPVRANLHAWCAALFEITQHVASVSSPLESNSVESRRVVRITNLKHISQFNCLVFLYFYCFSLLSNYKQVTDVFFAPLYFCNNKTMFLQVFAENRFLPWISVENRSPYPVLKYSLSTRVAVPDVFLAPIGATQRDHTPRNQI